MGFFLDMNVLGIKQVTGLIGGLQGDLSQGLPGRLKEAATLVADEAKARTHSKRVRAAINFDVEVKGPRNFRARVGPSQRKAFFAHFLEFGTRHSRAFPFLLPAKQATEERVVDLVGTPILLRGAR